MDIRWFLTFSQATVLVGILAAMLFSGNFARSIVNNAFTHISVDEKMQTDFVRFGTRFSFTLMAIISAISAIGNIVARLLSMAGTQLELTVSGIVYYGVTNLIFLMFAWYLVFVLPSLPGKTFTRYKSVGWIILLFENVWLIVLLWLI